jgi:hypothetical protein
MMMVASFLGGEETLASPLRLLLLLLVLVVVLRVQYGLAEQQQNQRG